MIAKAGNDIGNDPAAINNGTQQVAGLSFAIGAGAVAILAVLALQSPADAVPDAERASEADTRPAVIDYVPYPYESAMQPSATVERNTAPGAHVAHTND